MSLFPPSSSIKTYHTRSSSSKLDALFLFNHRNRTASKLHCVVNGVPIPAVEKDRLETNISSLSSSVGSPHPLPLSQWNLDRSHIRILNFTACVAAISASWVFFSAIPTLLAFRKAAESLEKLMDVAAEELPDTMAAVRLSGMEISDLTMELSDLSQEITQGVRSSTRAVRVAEDRLRRLTTMTPSVSLQGPETPRIETDGPVFARGARNLREEIVKGRAVLGAVFSITRSFKWALSLLAARGRKSSL